MSLSMVAIGETKIVLELKGKDDVKRHLQDIGLVKGETIQVIGENQSGIILLVKGTKVAINKGLANRIFVE